MTQTPESTTKIELSWDDALSGQFPQADTAARSAWREAVATVAAKAKTALPACNGRIDKAVQIVLAGDVIRMRDGRAMVGSQSDAGVHYVVNGACECPDADRAPEGWCKHRLAAAIDQRAYALASAQMQALDPAPAEALPQCPIHGVAMQKHRNAKGSWYSHKVSDGSWCRGKAQ
jgi:hypothetical protein